MNPYIRLLASLKLTVILLILIAVALSFGTILESLHGTEAARAVYYAPWFFALEGLFAINIIGAIWERFPRNRYRIGFLITHASMLFILGGALATAAYTIEGRLPLWEGESANRILRAGPHGTETDYAIPFSVRLDAFEMDLYPGTQRPAMFRSRVTVRDAAGAEHPAVIEMNRPLSFGGYSFFQSSYDMHDGREMSILSVSKDPGQPIVFVGYTLLVLGMLIVLVTRIFQTRAAGVTGVPVPGTHARIPLRGGAVRPRPGAKRAIWIAAGAVAAFAAAATPATAADPPTRAQLEAIRRLPVQHDGRTMPLDTQARDAVRAVTGGTSWHGYDPVALVTAWTVEPQQWLDAPVVKVDDKIALLAGRSAGTRYLSYRTLLSSDHLRQAIGQAMMRQQSGRKPAKADKDLVQVEERLSTLDAFLRGEAIRPLPVPEPRGAWRSSPHVGSAALLSELESKVRPTAPPHYPSREAIDREVLYNAVNPTHIAWFFLLPAALAAGLTLERDRWRLTWLVRIATVAGFAVMTWGVATRWQVAGRIPASNMYESMLFLAWGVGLFAVVSVLFKNRMLGFNATAMSALVMLLLDRLPIDPFIRPMPPVLSGTPWLAIHVPIIMVSYSTFAIATFLGHLVLGAALFSPGNRGLAERWSTLLYWYIMVGSILLIAGILTGSIWASSSWGRYWGWDPKEVWSLVAFLAYMAILHARFDGMLSPIGVAISSIAAFWTILMTYLGVNFVLASGLHSYGFGNSSLVRVMVIILLVETAFVTAGWRAARKARAGGRA
ncbi:MAG TPA: cytochrome c biogenesis protein CcsA [Candidatus Eisenbacteria bacterium]|nr:cytochrome c biogenesis protein CcsA [Candidatus Eisenbacteria bacterium]